MVMEKRAVFSSRLLPYALLVPQVAITLIFFYWPAVQALWQSFLLQDAFGLSTDFVWFENYKSLFAQPEYYHTMLNTLVFSTAVTVLSLSSALLLAAMADKQLRGSQIYTTLLIWPYAVAPAVAGVLWVFMLHPSLGIVARGLRSLGLDWNPLLNGTHAMVLVILASAWKQISYNFLFFLAGLQAIPKSVIEAAAIDGARPMRRFWTIIFPLLSPTTFFLIVVNIVYAFFDTFGIIDAMTGGGPARATETLVYKVYQDGRLGGDLGGSAAQSVILMIIVPHLILWIGIVIVAFPVYIALIASTHEPSIIANGQMPLTPGGRFLENYYRTIFVGTSSTTREPVGTMLFNSLVMALCISLGKIAISIISAYSVVYFRFPFRKAAFWIIFVTLMLPVEVRIYPTYKVASDLNLLDSYAGLTLPLIASATATLLFRQLFMTIPDELAEASKIDGAGPVRFFVDTVLPLSRTNMAALFVILFIYGWNQYLWPLLITTRDDMQTIVIGIKKMIVTSDALTEWQLVMCTAMLAMLPPVAVVVLMQRLFVKGLVETEK